MPTNAEPPEATDRFAPYRTYRFRLQWDGRYVASFSKVSTLTRKTQVVNHRSGGDPATPRRMPGQSESAALSLERGVAHDPAFEQWANKVWDYHNATTDDQVGDADNPVTSLADFRKDLILEVYNETGQKVIAYTIHRAWPSEFVAMPEVDTNANTVAIMSLKLETEGWERDTALPEPGEPSFFLPTT